MENLNIVSDITGESRRSENTKLRVRLSRSNRDVIGRIQTPSQRAIKSLIRIFNDVLANYLSPRKMSELADRVSDIENLQYMNMFMLAISLLIVEDLGIQPENIEQKIDHLFRGNTPEINKYLDIIRIQRKSGTITADQRVKYCDEVFVYIFKIINHRGTNIIDDQEDDVENIDDPDDVEYDTSTDNLDPDRVMD